MFFESHAHYDDKRYDQDRTLLLEGLKSKGVDLVVNVGADMKSSKKALLLSEEYDFIYAAVGVHPHEAEHVSEGDMGLLEAYCSNKKVVAVGEIGLDFYYDHSPRDIQRYWFKKQLELSIKVNKPVIIHSRDAAAECFDIIEKSQVRKGVVHCYSGSAEMAQDYVKLGYYIGIGGVVTFDKTKKLIEVVDKIPMESILIETDCPYLSPTPNRGKRNDSSNLVYIAEKIAEIKGISLESVAEISYRNASQLFFAKEN